MHSRASELLQALGMRPHPEGGHYAELYRSPRRVEVLERKVHRSAITSIYFLLAAGEYSRWHRVMSDEIWHYHEGDAIELVLFDQQGLRRLRLGPVSRETRPTIVVPAGTWQAARTTGAYTLGACTVGPGFEFADFSLAVDWPEIAAKIADAGPDLTRFI
ncbi:MAG TPA: cupin domain-containing protein [Gemmatimonadaceae bacterium]|jgi:predicted cupin superfamily sugar epimerase|nr:cupin domain-containing protein [Gemmatimonadaceae bacterium]